MLTTQRHGLYIIEDSIKGRGVFTTENISKGDLIEICPVIILSSEDTKLIHNTRLHDYYFVWDIQKKTSVIALGYGSLYNHSEQANAEFETDYDLQVIRIVAKKLIEANEEICLHYLSEEEDDIGLWFDVK